jgi:lysophospholipase L1-like esterase
MELVPQLSPNRADVVLIALGVNDSIEFHTAGRWVADLKRLIEGIRARVGDVPVLLAGVPPLEYFPALPQPLSFVLGARSTALARATFDIARQIDKVVHVPFQVDNNGTREMFCADGFHPSELGYKLWAGQLAEAFTRRGCQNY